MSNSNHHPSIPHWGHSLRVLSWDKFDHKTKSQELISSTVHEWYDAKHRTASDEEIKLINSIEISCCFICDGTDIVRNGTYRNGTRRYLCRYCSSSFNPLTDTIFEDKKIPISEWIEYLLHLSEFHSITSSSRDNRNACSTGRYWLYKVFSILKHYQDDILLEGKITLDETFFSVKPSKEKRHRNGLKLKGISGNKLCVVCGKDDRGHIVLLCENTSKPSHKSTWKHLTLISRKALFSYTMAKDPIPSLLRIFILNRSSMIQKKSESSRTRTILWIPSMISIPWPNGS